jgi:hypothetical protein
MCCEPVATEKDALNIEKDIQHRYNFTKLSVNEKALSLYHDRLLMLNIPDRDKTALRWSWMQHIVYASGSEAAHFKKLWMDGYLKVDPGFKLFVKDLFGGWYTDI